MTIEELRRCLQLFVTESRTANFLRAIKEIKEKLFQTKQMYPNLRLYSASVLMVYDGDQEGTQVNAKLIDFAHAYIDVQAEGGVPDDPSFDDNAMIGLESLVSLLVN
jgi:hypothetical protein